MSRKETLRHRNLPSIVRNGTEDTGICVVDHVLKKDVSWCWRMIWILSYLACLGLTAVTTVERIQHYLSYPVTVNVKLDRHQMTQFPAVTFCAADLLHVIIAAFYKYRQYNCTKPEFDEHLPYKIWCNSDYFNNSFDRFWNISILDDEINIDSTCISSSKSLVECGALTSEFFMNRTIINTVYGKCLTFRSDKYLKVRGPYTYIRFNVTTSRTIYRFMKEDVFDVMFYIHSPNIVPGYETMFRVESVPFGSLTEVRLDVKEFTYKNTANNSCVPEAKAHDEANKCFESTFSIDRPDCKMPYSTDNIIGRSCNFTETLESLKVEFESYLKINENECYKSKPCKDIVYSSFLRSKAIDSNNTAILKILMGSGIKEIIHETHSYSIQSLLSDLAAYWGLFLGFSFLGVVEFFSKMSEHYHIVSSKQQVSVRSN